MKTIPAWRTEVRDALVAKLQGAGYKVQVLGADLWSVRPPEVDMDLRVTGIGSLAAIWIAETLLHANGN